MVAEATTVAAEANTMTHFHRTLLFPSYPYRTRLRRPCDFCAASAAVGSAAGAADLPAVHLGTGLVHRPACPDYRSSVAALAGPSTSPAVDASVVRAVPFPLPSYGRVPRSVVPLDVCVMK